MTDLANALGEKYLLNRSEWYIDTIFANRHGNGVEIGNSKCRTKKIMAIADRYGL